MKTILISAILILFTVVLSADSPPLPNGNGGAPNGGNIPVGGSADTEGGIYYLLAFAATMGIGKMIYLKVKPLKSCIE